MLDTLELQTIQVKLNQASFSKSLRTKREALIYYKTHIGYSLDNQHESIFKEIARHNGVHPTDYKISIHTMYEYEVDIHIMAAHQLLNSEISKRSYDIAKYVRAEKILFSPENSFTQKQVLYTNVRNEHLSVDEMLRVAKYSIAYIETMHPDDKNIELASAAITVFQGIELALNNQPQTIPVSKKLHIANTFLATVVKANVKDSDTKRGITIASALIDLAIDFFSGN